MEFHLNQRARRLLIPVESHSTLNNAMLMFSLNCLLSETIQQTCIGQRGEEARRTSICTLPWG